MRKFKVTIGNDGAVTFDFAESARSLMMTLVDSMLHEPPTEGAPFPWHGGKHTVASEIWRRLGEDVPNYVEPFLGSAAVLLDRPGGAGKIETVNDLDGLLANLWRSIKLSPSLVAEAIEAPPCQVDLEARAQEVALLSSTLATNLRLDPSFHHADAAAWWLYGVSASIGATFTQRNKRPRLHTGNYGKGIFGLRKRNHRSVWLSRLADRLRHVRIDCGDWTRVVGEATTTKVAPEGILTGVFLDPPYHGFAETYGTSEVARDVRAWAIEHGRDPMLRIAMAGYDDFEMPMGWTCSGWTSRGTSKNSGRERLWFSPHCLRS